MSDKPNRPKVGPADPETLHKKFRESMDEPTRAEGVAPRPSPSKPPKPKPKKKRSAFEEVRDALDPKVKRDRTVEGKNVGTDDMATAIERGIKEANEDSE